MICNSIYDCNYSAENDPLQALKLDQMYLEEQQKAAGTGCT
jgi:hypothetical protein